MNKRGYVSHAVGKWHLGFFKTSYTPTFRGFDSFYGYYEGSEDYYTHITSGGMDLHHEEGQRCGPNCTKLVWEKQGEYSTNMYTTRAVDLISKHDPTKPLFMYLAYQGVHAPRQAPVHYWGPYNKTIADFQRRQYAGMISALDEGMGNVSLALKAKGMWEDTLILVTTDNGGPTTECSTSGQSNWPYRGSKCSIWEGGTRGTGFVYWSGLPDAVRGSTWSGLAHAADWLPTIASAVGSPVKAGETLTLDGVDLWNALVTNTASPRTEVYYGISEGKTGPAARDMNGYKLIVGGNGGGKGQWTPQQLPNYASPASFGLASIASGDALYNVYEDPGERAPLAIAFHSDIIKGLQQVVEKYEKTRVPQQGGDPSCPEFAPIDSAKGKWIGPWCDDVAGEAFVV
jgi:arylsulfatase A-like enzyme